MILTSRLPTASVAAVMCSVGVLAGASSAQQPVFRAGIDIARVSVRVLDAERRPIRGLTAQDFTVLVNGVIQPVVTTYTDEFDEGTTGGAPWLGEITSDVATNSLGHPRLIVIILDDALFSSGTNDPFQVKQTKAIGRSIIEQLRPSDLGAVCFSLDAGQSQDFTTDRGRLLAAVDKFHASAINPGLALNYSVKMLMNVMQRLSEVPDRSSAIMWVSVGFGNHESVGRALVQFVRAGQTTRHLSVVPVYPISPVGLRAPGPRWIRQDRTHPRTMRGIAIATGSRAVVDTNAPADLVPAIMREVAVHYTIGFAPRYSLTDGKYKKIEIRVNRPGALVQPPDGIVLSPSARDVEAARKALPIAVPTSAALSGILPMPDEPLRLAVAPFATTATGGQRPTPAAIAVALGVSLGPTETGAAGAPVKVDIELRLFDGEGRTQLDERHQSLQVASPLSAAAAQQDVLSTLVVKPGRYNLRVSTHNRATGKTASVYTDVTVPDYTKVPVSLSGVVLTALPGRTATPAAEFADFLPLVPTTSREFSAVDRVTAFLRVYWGGTAPPMPVPLRATIVDTGDRAVFGRTDTLLPADIAAPAPRSADYRLDLPVAALDGGQYLLRLVATPAKGGEIRRDVRFTIR